jgi:hypothetical protein
MSGGVLSPPARQLILIVLVAACGRAQGTFAQTVVPGGRHTIEPAQGSDPPPDLSFRHFTTEHGLSQDDVVAILQDFCGSASFHAPSTDWIGRRGESPIMFPVRTAARVSRKAVS